MHLLSTFCTYCVISCADRVHVGTSSANYCTYCVTLLLCSRKPKQMLIYTIKCKKHVLLIRFMSFQSYLSIFARVANLSMSESAQFLL